MAGNEKSGRKKIDIPKKPLLTSEEAARIIGISADQVRAHADRDENRIPHYRIGNQRRFKKEDVLAWLEKQKKNVEQHES